MVVLRRFGELGEYPLNFITSLALIRNKAIILAYFKNFMLEFADIH